MKILVLKENLSGGYEERERKKNKPILVAHVSLLSQCNPRLVVQKTSCIHP